MTSPTCAKRCRGWARHRGKQDDAQDGDVRLRRESDRDRGEGTPLADRLSDDQISQILAESSDSFAKFLTPTGELRMPIRAHLVMGRKR